MSIAPGLFTDGAAVATRIFLGQMPLQKVDALLTRQVQPVFAWYTSRPRVNEQGSSFLSLDAAGCDVEVLLRYCHVFYVRRNLHQDLLDKQINLLETGKPAKEANAGLLQALGDINNEFSGRHEYEVRRMKAAKERATIPFRRELDPSAPLDPWDVVPLMRCVAEDDTSVDAERRAKVFLPIPAVDRELRTLLHTVAGIELPAQIDKRLTRILGRNTPADYEKIGSLPKLRPVDVTARARFYADRFAKPEKVPADDFERLLWGNVMRRYASHPAVLSSISKYWPLEAGLTKSAESSTMPSEIAKAVCSQQDTFPAHRFRAQFLYTNIDHTKQAWRADSFIPLPRLMPFFGHHAAEDLAAATLVDSWWTSNLKSDANPLDDGVVRMVRHFVADSARLRQENSDLLLTRLVDGAKATLIPLTKEEQHWTPAPLETKSAEQEHEAFAAESDEGSGREASVTLPNEVHQ
jgi:hypothetical protein